MAAQEGHAQMAKMLIEHEADVNASAKNGLTPMHLCAQEDKVPVAEILANSGSKLDPQTNVSSLHKYSVYRETQQ